jgi:hypothetical protein
MENEQMKAVLNEILENQLELSRSQAETPAVVQQLKVSLEGIETTLKSRSENNPAIDSTTIQHAVINGMAEVKLLLQMYIAKPPSKNLKIFL